MVDNGSSPEQLEQLCAGLGRAELIRNTTNLGFTGGVNIGLTRAAADGADYIWLVNNDLIAPPQTLEQLVSAVEGKPEIGLVSPVIRNADAGDEIEFCGGLWREDNTFSTTSDLKTYFKWQAEYPDRIWLVGTALMMSRHVFETVGLFDSRFFAYWEDNDYSIRSITSGFNNVVVDSADVFHRSGNQNDNPISKPPHYYYYITRNEILFLKKYARIGLTLKLTLWALDRQLRQTERLKDHPTLAEAILLGLWDGICGRVGSYAPERQLSMLGRLVIGTCRRIVLYTFKKSR
ncbi:Glycosyl transferase family protein [Acidiphilium sp. PM]|nr:Glycosyl transferase family protein [Acidiphilium sp. PM]